MSLRRSSSAVGGYGPCLSGKSVRKDVHLMPDRLVLHSSVFMIGFACRYGLHSNPQDGGLFKAEYLLIILAVSCHGMKQLVLLLIFASAKRVYRCRLCHPQSYSDTYRHSSASPHSAFESYLDLRHIGRRHLPHSGALVHALVILT